MKKKIDSWQVALTAVIMLMLAVMLSMYMGGQGLYAWTPGPGQDVVLDNNRSLSGKDTGGAEHSLLSLRSDNNTRLNAFAGNNILFTIGGNEKVRLTSAGNLLLNNNLSVSGKDTGGVEHSLLSLRSDNNTRLNAFAGNNIFFTIGGNEKARFTPAGDLLLNNNLSLSGKDTGGTEHSLVSLRNDDNTRLNAFGGHNILFTIGGTEKVRLTSDGRVGIGTTPDVLSKLHVNSTSTASGSAAIISAIPGDNSTAVFGLHVTGDNWDSYGCLGLRPTAGVNIGAYGRDIAHGTWGALGLNEEGTTKGIGAFGKNEVSGYYGGLGFMDSGAAGRGVRGTLGALGTIGTGVYGSTDNASLNAGTFVGNTVIYGNLNVTGTLTKGGGIFKIDHPQDPENKYLSHSFVESPDMKNIYDGTIKLDEKGEAQVALPSYFESLNRDFRYQLTCIGGYAPVYVAKRISGNQFKIAGGNAGLEVSWQVTGIRKDVYANAHPIVVEQEKTASEKGLYLHPEEWGQSKEKGIGQINKPLE